MKLRNAVVVLTGASSGIGRAAALQFADEGCKLVLAARDVAALDEVVQQCNTRGGEAIAVPTNVDDDASVRALRDQAVARFGTIDVWVNDAAHYVMGSVEETPLEAYRRVLETNFLGVVRGSQAALEVFRKKDRGVLINVGSVAGKSAYALASAYVASKHALHAFTEALRQELVGTAIEACIVAPGTVDTPLFQHAANYTGREIEAMKPIYAPERVARAIVSCAKRPRREVLIGLAPRVFSLSQMLMPWLWERMQPAAVARDHLGSGPVAPTPGNFDAPTGPHEVHGGWKERRSGGAKGAFLVGALALPLLIPLGRRLLS
ncbi:MAG: SDR family NAD(P)-dependent oxidoreductase [Deltaproteobacteria bacterium]|nr:SDR family NAD(P)-dependent oxidoreductase [Deltaproteobacteria bacterium]